MAKTEGYRQALRKSKNWDPFLLENSGLPGPRGNLELAHVVAQQGDREQFNHFLTYHAEENTPDVLIVFCGVLGLGQLAAAQPKIFNRLREYASDPRWRIREACRGRRACRTLSPETAKACQTGSATIGQNHFNNGEGRRNKRGILQSSAAGDGLLLKRRRGGVA